MGGYGQLLSRLFQFALTKITPAASIVTSARSFAGRAGPAGLALSIGAMLVDLLNIDELRQEAVKIAPRSDPEALEEAARQIIRMTGADGTKTFWPKGAPRVYCFDLATGNQWFISRYINRKWLQNAYRRGFQAGVRSGQRQIATLSQAQHG